MGALKDKLEEKNQATLDRYEKNAAMAALMVDLAYPVAKDGNTVIDLQGLQGVIAWHLVRCGWRPDPEKRMIKPRRIIAHGVARNAVEWVGVNEPDMPDYNSMTVAEINALPPVQKAQALRATGLAKGDVPNLPDNPGWKVTPHLTIVDEPDTDDQFDWTRGTK